jgi:hypothetical protein
MKIEPAMRHIPTSRLLWLSPPLFWYLAGVAGLVAGAVVVIYGGVA